MRIDILTLFPDAVEASLKISILGRAEKKGILDIHAVQIRDYTENRQKQVDDYPYGGGWGQVLTLGAAEGGFVDEAAGDVHAAFMVHTGFGDDVGTLEAGDRDGVLADEVDEVHKTLREKVRWLRENRGYPCLVPLPRTPVKWRKPASKPCG